MLSPIREFLWKLIHIFGRQKSDDLISGELDFHLQMEIEANIRQGMSSAEARRCALIALGGAEQTKEEYRETCAIRWAVEFKRDLGYGWRMMRKSPRFTAIAVLTLALGIGANSAIFSAVNGILLISLPYANLSRLVTIQRKQIAYGITSAQLSEIRQHCAALEHVAAYNPRWVLFTGGKIPKQGWASSVSSEFFPLLGVNPLLGRPILPEETGPGSDRVAVLSHGFWVDAFGGDMGVVGRNISIDRKEYTVVGVMPREFGVGIHEDYPSAGSDDIWIPPTAPRPGARDDGSSLIIAQLKKNATLDQLNAQLQPLSAHFAAEYPPGREGLDMFVRSFDPGIDPRVKTGLLILLGAVGFVLLMACVNVTSLLVARSWTRQRELAVRKALGASRLRILRQLLAESLLLALAGGALGLFLSVWGIRLLRALAPPNIPRVDRILLNGNVVWFTMAISLLVAVLVGLAPALQASSLRAGEELKGSPGSSFAGIVISRPHRLRNALVVMEVLLAVIVVVGGALMARSFYKLMSVDTGVSAGRVLAMHIQFSDLVCTWKNADWAAQEKKCWMGGQEVLNRIRLIPGVQRATLCFGGPFQGGSMTGHYPGSGQTGVFVEGLAGDQLRAGEWIVNRSVAPEYFAALGIRIVKGRDFEPGDTSSRVAIVSESFARKYIPGYPIGKRFSTGSLSGQLLWMEIIGVVNDVRDQSIAATGAQGPVYYSPFQGIGSFGFGVIVQTSSNPFPLIPAITRAVQSVDRDAPVTDIRTVDQILASSSAEPRFQTALVGSFSVLGLLLAVIGVYGVISYSVVQQTHDIGVRMAMGAQPSDILRMILKEGMLLAAIGIPIGIAGALGLTRVLRNMLYEIEPTDPATFLGVTVFLTIAALGACYIPALRAAKVDPMVALRHE